jgi:putative lipoprotein
MRRSRLVARILAVAAAALGASLAAAAGPAEDEAGTRIFRGNFLVGKSGALFSPCFSGTRVRLEDATAGGALGAAYREIAPQPGWAIFVEFSGRESGGHLRAEKLHRASAGGPGCAESIAELGLVALGSDPVWGLESRASGIRMRILRESAPREFPPPSVTTNKDEPRGETRYETATANSVLRIVVRPGACRDALSGSLFDHIAEVHLDDLTLQGCAYWGDLERHLR